jgi:hypothetical protein
MRTASLAHYEVSQGAVNMISVFATSNLNMELNLGRAEFENADWTERGRDKVQRKLHVLPVHALA